MMTWLTSFYIIFVSFLEFVSELTGSQERRFYHNWWDATTMEEFWRWWNLPVHRWCVKHVYLPLLARGGDKIKAMMAVFLFSASLHEFLISGRFIFLDNCIALIHNIFSATMCDWTFCLLRVLGSRSGMSSIINMDKKVWVDRWKFNGNSHIVLKLNLFSRLSSEGLVHSYVRELSRSIDLLQSSIKFNAGELIRLAFEELIFNFYSFVPCAR